MASSLQDWIVDVSSFVKAQDPNHLVTVGEEGFYGPGSPDVDQNPTPGSGQWCSLTGRLPVSSVNSARLHLHEI